MSVDRLCQEPQAAAVFRRVTKRFRESILSEVVALKEVTLEIRQGDFLIVIGHNGSGKTTLLNLLAGDYPPDSGEIFVGADSHCGRAPRISRVRQDPAAGTFSDLSVLENFQLFRLSGTPSPFRFSVGADFEREVRGRLARHALDQKLHQRVSELSQGQRQIVSLELAMWRRPQLLLLDEHTASLDKANAKICMNTTVRLTQDAGTTVVMITHNLVDALHYGNALVVMREGRATHTFRGQEKKELDLQQLIDYCGFLNTS